jgi:hypothetical protein
MQASSAEPIGPGLRMTRRLQGAAPCGRGSSRGIGAGTRVALLIAFCLAAAPGDVSAAAVRHSATAIGALAVLAALMLVREWPVGLTGSLWAAGTLFAAAFWLIRTGYRPDWLPAFAGRRLRIDATALHRREEESRDGAAVSRSDAALAAARRCFIELQSAWDAGDIERMRAHTTAEMLDELLQQLPTRGAGINRTDVLTLHAALLMMEPVGARWLASVEFSGMIRESLDDGAKPFREVWMLTCADSDAPEWRLARQQALM